MSIWDFLVYAAWGISGLIFLWMIVNVFMVASVYSEDFLTSSREGQDL